MHAAVSASPEPRTPSAVAACGRRSLTYRVRFESDDVAVLHLDGDLAGASAADLSDALEAWAAVGIATVQIDGELVTFADSHAVHVLADHAARFASNGGWLRIKRPSRPLRRIVEIAGLAPILLLES